MATEAKVRTALRDFAESLGDKAYRIPIDLGVRRGGKLDEFWIVNGHGVGVIILNDDALLTKSLKATMENIYVAKGLVMVVRDLSNESFGRFKSVIKKFLTLDCCGDIDDFYDEGDDE
jgi:hypothetical protein